MRKEKKGISLIVLVITIIVIIILAVAVILSIANNNPIENAKEARFKNDVKTMQEELELLKASKYAENNGEGYGKIEIGDLKSATNYQEKFAVKDGELKYIAEKLTDEEKTWVSASGVTEQIILKMGREITYKNEQFYVIGGEKVGTEVTDDTQDILLLAKYNLKEENGKLIQDGAGDEGAFCSDSAWSGANISSVSVQVNLNEKTTISSEATSAVGKAIAYGESLGATGRLMTKSEAENLQTDYSKILYGTGKGYLNYWLGTSSSYSSVNVWIIGGAFNGFLSYKYDGSELKSRGTPSYKSLKVFGPISDLCKW